MFLFDLDEDALTTALSEVEVEGVAAAGSCAFRGDVRSRAEVLSAVEECESQLGPVDILLNHAGIGPSRHVLQITDDEWDEVIAINLTGAFTVAQVATASMMRVGGGVVINMSSTGGIAAEPGHAHYAATKAAILALTRAMALDLAPNGIRVCAICPGAIDTFDFGNVEMQRIYESRIPAGRSGTADEVAAVYAYLASDDAKHITGAAFTVDGGMLAWE